ncbi:hypothetical protein [Streptomyces sp. NPDC007094]|uniref:hypothetical protein n=1 Tax=Streptomyces sp. NPDC007094 TaxID=3155359 RepID=UPI0033C57A68
MGLAGRWRPERAFRRSAPRPQDELPPQEAGVTLRVSGGGFVDDFGQEGAAVSFDVETGRAGTYDAGLRYSNGPNPAPGTKTVSSHVDGERVRRTELLPTTDRKTWSTASPSSMTSPSTDRPGVAQPRGLAAGAIRLQDHGSRTRYRNVWVEPLTQPSRIARVPA